MTRRTALALVLALALPLLLVALAGCGGDDDEAADTTAADTTAADTTAAETTTGGGGGSTLNGSVGPGFSISLDGTDGLAAGDYTIAVEDLSAEHNFHLTGPGGVDVSTSVGEEGEESFDVALEPGEYTFVCDPHASQMRGSFTVG